MDIPETTAGLILEREALRTVANMALQQLEFTYGLRGRGWDSQYLMDRLRAVLGKTEQPEKESEHE